MLILENEINKLNELKKQLEIIKECLWHGQNKNWN